MKYHERIQANRKIKVIGGEDLLSSEGPTNWRRNPINGKEVPLGGEVNGYQQKTG